MGIGGALGKLGRDISATSKKFGSEFATGVTAEKAGLGKYKPADIAIDESAFKDTSRSQTLIDELKKQREEAAARQAEKVTGATIGTAAQAEAAKLGAASQMTPAQLAAAEKIKGEQLAREHEQFRGRQMTLADALTQQAAGQGPSLAQAQLDAARNQQIQTAMALAASQRGMTAGQGLRSIADQTAAANQFAASEAAKQRIAEQLSARQQLAGVLQGARGQDIDVAATQAGLSQQANLANQQAANAFALQQGQMNQQAGLANQQALNDFMLQQGAWQQQAGLANQQAANAFAMRQAELNQQANLANQQAGLQMTNLNQDFANALNQQIGGLTMGQQASLQQLEAMKLQKALEQQAIEAGAFKDWSGRTTGFISGLGEALTGMGKAKEAASTGGGAAGAAPPAV